MQPDQSPRTLRTTGLLFILVTSLAIGACSREADESRASEEVRTVASVQTADAGELSVHPVISAGIELLVVLGPAEAQVDLTEGELRRVSVGADTDLVIHSNPRPTEATAFTLASERRNCVASVGQRVTLWTTRRGNDERLSDPVEAVELEDCAEMEFGEWLLAISGQHPTAQWHRPIYTASVEGQAEVEGRADDAENDATESMTHIARFHLDGIELSAHLRGCLSTAPQTTLSRCPSNRPLSISLVQRDQVVVSFEAGERLGALSIDEASFIVHLTTDRSVLRAWQVREGELALVTETSRLGPSSASDA